MSFEKFLKNFEKNSLKALFNEKLVFSSKTGFLPIFFLFSGYCWVKCIEICKIIVTSMVNYIWEQNLCHFWNLHFFACLELSSVSFIVSYGLVFIEFESSHNILGERCWYSKMLFWCQLYIDISNRNKELLRKSWKSTQSNNFDQFITPY